jgi:hypothetical protein
MEKTQLILKGRQILGLFSILKSMNLEQLQSVFFMAD